MDHRGEGGAVAPAEALQIGDLGYAVDLTGTEPGDGTYVVGQADQEEQELVAVAADPADNALGLHVTVPHAATA